MSNLKLSEEEKSELRVSHLSEICLTFHNSSDKTFDIYKPMVNVIAFEISDHDSGESAVMRLTYEQVEMMMKFIKNK